MSRFSPPCHLTNDLCVGIDTAVSSLLGSSALFWLRCSLLLRKEPLNLCSLGVSCEFIVLCNHRLLGVKTHTILFNTLQLSSGHPDSLLPSSGPPCFVFTLDWLHWAKGHPSRLPAGPGLPAHHLLSRLWV